MFFCYHESMAENIPNRRDSQRLQLLSEEGGQMITAGVLKKYLNPEKDSETFFFALDDGGIGSLFSTIVEGGHSSIDVVVSTHNDSWMEVIHVKKVDANLTMAELNELATLQSLIDHMGQRGFFTWKERGWRITYQGRVKRALRITI